MHRRHGGLSRRGEQRGVGVDRDARPARGQRPRVDVHEPRIPGSPRAAHPELARRHVPANAVVRTGVAGDVRGLPGHRPPQPEPRAAVPAGGRARADVGRFGGLAAIAEYDRQWALELDPAVRGRRGDATVGGAPCVHRSRGAARRNLPADGVGRSGLLFSHPCRRMEGGHARLRAGRGLPTPAEYDVRPHPVGTAAGGGAPQCARVPRALGCGDRTRPRTPARNDGAGA